MNDLLNAVWASRTLDMAAKVVLARIADRIDGKGYCFPSIDSLAGDCGLSRRAVLWTLERLEWSGYLTITRGEGRRPNRYQIAQLRLQCSTPIMRPSEHRRLSCERRSPQNKARSGEQRSLQGGSDTPCVAVNVAPAVVNVVPRSSEQRSPEPKGTVREPKKTGADAPARSPEGTTPQTGADAPEPAQGEDHSLRAIPFSVYASIAKDAIAESLRTDKTTDPSNVGEWFKRGCAQHDPPLPYTAELTRRAVDAALYARQKAAEQFHETFKQLAGGRSMS